jgi:group I intron endonuclease
MLKEKIKIICGIYGIENLTNAKIYTGQAQNIRMRWRRHKNELNNNKNKCIYLQNAWNEYEENNFIFYIIKECSIGELDKWEEYYIKEYHTHISEWGYNISWGGQASMRGMHHTDETKNKMSQSEMGENNPFWDKKHTDETKEKMKNNHCDYSGENHPRYGKEVFEISKEKASKTNQGIKTKVTSSKYVGVNKTKSKRNPWKATIMYRGKSYNLGVYKTEIDAALAYNKKALELYGESAKLNIID